MMWASFSFDLSFVHSIPLFLWWTGETGEYLPWWINKVSSQMIFAKENKILSSSENMSSDHVLLYLSSDVFRADGPLPPGSAQVLYSNMWVSAAVNCFLLSVCLSRFTQSVLASCPISNASSSSSSSSHYLWFMALYNGRWRPPESTTNGVCVRVCVCAQSYSGETVISCAPLTTTERTAFKSVSGPVHTWVTRSQVEASVQVWTTPTLTEDTDHWSAFRLWC